MVHAFPFLVAVALVRPLPAPDAAHEANARLGLGVNMGNILEAPREGEWGLKLDEGWFSVIKEAGFDHVRIPTKWSAHAGDGPPYRVDPAFFARIDLALDAAHFAGLSVVLNIHHFDEFDKDPDAAEAKFVAVWEQISARFAERGSMLYFELDNEPHEKLTTARWNAAYPKALAAIRKASPERFVIVGPGMWNGFRELPKLELPEADRRLIVTFHYYEPFEFTHQGTPWAKGSEKHLGRTWADSGKDLEALRVAFDQVAAWSKEHDRPIYLGEFGAYEKAPMPSRIAWTTAVSREAARRGFSFGYWEFADGFGLYDPVAKVWRPGLRDAVLKSRPASPAGAGRGP
jgi:endoglucanase